MSDFVELCTTTNFSFLRAASHPEEYVEQAWELDHAGIGIADRNTVAGVVRAYSQAREMLTKATTEEDGSKGNTKFKLAIGVRLVFRDGTPDIVVYPRDRAAYGRLTRLLTLGNKDAPKGECWLSLPMFLEHAEGQQAIVIPDLGEGALPDEHLRDVLSAIRTRCRSVWLAARFVFDGEDRRRLRRLSELAFETRARLIAIVPHARATRIARCDDLHSRKNHTGGRRPPARAQCRAPSQALPGNGAPLQTCARRCRRDGEIPERPFLPA
jgi:error-prone DNA polymerase